MHDLFSFLFFVQFTQSFTFQARIGNLVLISMQALLLFGIRSQFYGFVCGNCYLSHSSCSNDHDEHNCLLLLFICFVCVYIFFLSDAFNVVAYECEWVFGGAAAVYHIRYTALIEIQLASPHALMYYMPIAFAAHKHTSQSRCTVLDPNENSRWILPYIIVRHPIR